MRRRLLILPILAALSAGMGGCVSSSEQSNRGPASTVDDTAGSSTVDAQAPSVGVPSGKPGDPSCLLAPASLVGSTLGLALKEPTQYIVAQGIECGYQPVNPDSSSIMLRFLTGQDHNTFVAYRAGDTSGDSGPADLTGLGEEAYYTSSDFSSPTTHTVVARKGTVIVVASAGAELVRVQTLVQSLVTALT
jgi:hypothetical protein